MHIATASAQILPRPAIRLGTVTVGEPVSLTLASIAVSTDLRALLHRRIEDAELVVSDSRIQMPLPVARAARAAGARPRGSEPVRLVSIRSIALDNVRLVSRGRDIVVNAESALDGTRLTVRRFEARSGDTTFQAEGVVELTPRVDATMRVKADADGRRRAAGAGRGVRRPQRRQRRGSGPAPRIAARVSAERARAGGVEVRQFATDMQVDGERVSLSPLTFQLFGGRYQGSISARLGQTLQASLQSRIIDLDVAQLAAFGGVPGALTGTLTGAGTFSGPRRRLRRGARERRAARAPRRSSRARSSA